MATVYEGRIICGIWEESTGPWHRSDRPDRVIEPPEDVLGGIHRERHIIKNAIYVSRSRCGDQEYRFLPRLCDEKISNIREETSLKALRWFSDGGQSVDRP
jgi:hypothetical protein